MKDRGVWARSIPLPYCTSLSAVHCHCAGVPWGTLLGPRAFDPVDPDTHQVRPQAGTQSWAGGNGQTTQGPWGLGSGAHSLAHNRLAFPFLEEKRCVDIDWKKHTGKKHRKSITTDVEIHSEKMTHLSWMLSPKLKNSKQYGYTKVRNVKLSMGCDKQNPVLAVLSRATAL